MSAGPKMRILAVGGGIRQALPFYRSWRQAGHHITVLCPSRLTPGYASRYVGRRVLAPSIEDEPEAYHAAVLGLLQTGRYDVVFPFGHNEMYHCVRHKKELAEYALVPVAEPEVFMRSFDKAQTMAFCMDNGIPCPYTYFPQREDLESILARAEFPLWMKPGIGIGAVGGRRVDTPAEAREYLPAFRQRYGPMILQEFIPQDQAEQLVCHVFLNASAKLCARMVSSKPRYFPLRGGTSTCLISVDRPDVADYCTQLFEGIGLTGIADADVIVDPRDGQTKVMEINPRVSCSIKTGFVAGIDFADMWMRLARGERITPKLTYPTGLILRNLCQDILWYLFVDRQRRKAANPPFFEFFGNNTVYQTISADDPMPFFGFVLGMVRKYTAPGAWAAKVGKEKASRC